MTETIGVTELRDKHQDCGKEQIHTLQQGEEIYKAAYEAVLANSKEEEYQRGCREGFADCGAFRDLAPGAAALADTPMDTSKKTPAKRARLRGLPCSDCGCPSYSDESKCPRCGVSKTVLIGAQAGAIEELK